MAELLTWFTERGGVLDSKSVVLTAFPDQGMGAVALQDIPKDHTLFTIPRDLTLSTRTSSLPKLIGEDQWKKLKLHEGWVGVILCMMWEQAQGQKSKWFGYLRLLPTNFETLMFWSPDELEELKGCAVVDKIGKEDAERDYKEKLVPALESRPDLFPLDEGRVHYTLENYHIMGSRILSRSFHVEKMEDISSEKGDHESHRDEQDHMDVDPTAPDDVPDPIGEEQDVGSDDEDDPDVDDPSDVAMVPMADMLNARHGCENAKLFYEEKDLKMISTKPIKAGEQIWNTYGNPPNSDLLRRYGHVDIVPLPEGGEGNPADLVEVTADLVVDTVTKLLQEGRIPSVSAGKNFDFKERIDWWLEEGCEDVFIIEMDYVVPNDMISFVKLLLLSQQDWVKATEKGRPPKPKIDKESLPCLIAVLQTRLQRYPTTCDADEDILTDSKSGRLNLSVKKRHAVVVRIGEKRILRKALLGLDTVADSILSKKTHKEEKEKSKKRKNDLEMDDVQSEDRGGKRKKR